MEKLLKRKIDSFLDEWKKQSDRMPLIVRGARLIGKRGCGHFFGTNVLYYCRMWH